jgi:hypothetical protein
MPSNRAVIKTDTPHQDGPAQSVSQQATIQRLDKYARLLDSQFQIPGTSVKFGWDAIIGLLPGFGDLLGFALSSLLILEAKMAGAPLRLIARMLINALIEMIAGFIPVVGDAFDFYWKANLKNIELLKNHLAETTNPVSARRRKRWLVYFYILALLLMAGVVYVVWITAKYLAGPG